MSVNLSVKKIDRYDQFFKTIILLSLLCISASFLCNKAFFEKFFSSDGNIVDFQLVSYIALSRVVCVGFGIMFLIAYFSKKYLIKVIKSFLGDWRNAVLKFIKLSRKKISVSKLFPRPPYKIRFITMGILIIWSFFCLYAFNSQSVLFSQLTKENGITETLTVIFYFVAAGFAIAYIINSKRKMRNLGMRKWWLILAAVFFIFVAMEEINWGQNYLSFKTPDFMSGVNIQKEVSLHNIMIPQFNDTIYLKAYWSDSLARLLSITIGVVVPILLWTVPIFARLFLAMNIPLPSVSVLYGFIFAAIIPSRKFFQGMQFGYHEPTEIREFTIALSFFFMIWHLYYQYSINTKKQ